MKTNAVQTLPDDILKWVGEVAFEIFYIFVTLFMKEVVQTLEKISSHSVEQPISRNQLIVMNQPLLFKSKESEQSNTA